MRFAVVSTLAILCLFGCRSREEKLKRAEEAARLTADTKARMVKGVGESLQTEGKAGAESITRGVGEVVKGVTKGFDASLSEVKVLVAPQLASRGIQVTRASRKGWVLSVYVIADQAFSGPMTLRALDRQKAEIGRAVLDCVEKAGSAHFVDFTFDPRTPVAAIQDFELR